MNDEDFGAEENIAADLRDAVNAVDLSNSLTGPLKSAIENLLHLAARAVNSQVASVLVRDGNEGGLKFLTAISEAKTELLKLRIPPGKGIAGLVFSTGQPTCVADVRGEGSFWSKADEQTGFKTITLLATPLRLGYETIGVLEFVNRPGEPPYPPFTPEEMDRADPFANMIARLVDAYEIAELVESLFTHSIKISMETEGMDLGSDTREWIRGMDAAPEHRELLLLGVSLRELVSRGDSERELCRDVLDALLRFSEKRSASSGYSGF